MTREHLEKLNTLKEQGKSKTKAKPFSKMTAAEKNELLELVCKMLGIIE